MTKEEVFNLIKQIIKKNDKKSFEILIDMYKKMVINLCFHYFNNKEDAEDSAQDVFVKVFLNLKGFKFNSNFSTWLYKITENTCRNKIKSKEFKVKRMTGNKDCEVLNLKDNSNDITEKLSIEEENNVIRNAISKLPWEKRSMIILRDIEKLSYEDISEITGFKLGTVKSALSRAREQLTQLLKGELL